MRNLMRQRPRGADSVTSFLMLTTTSLRRLMVFRPAPVTSWTSPFRRTAISVYLPQWHHHRSSNLSLPVNLSLYRHHLRLPRCLCLPPSCT